MTGTIVVTGGDGFIGKNLRIRLAEQGYSDVVGVTRTTTESELRAALESAAFVFHLAGVNRPPDPSAFDRDNRDFTASVCRILADASHRAPVVYASSTQASLDNPYGRSKRAAEEIVESYGRTTGARTQVLRLTNVFGKWSRPNYNSAVATFCHNLVHGLPLTIHDPTAALSLVYIDDVVAALISLLIEGDAQNGLAEVGPVYRTTVGEIADLLRSFACSRQSLLAPSAGTGLGRALYATYLSHLPPSEFVYPVQKRVDARGSFVEVLKTEANGQVSYFTAFPGVTRGEHYHHSKTEKFLVVKGTARFGFRNIVTNETHDVTVSGDVPQVVETVPGWAHDVTNVGNDDMVVMLWANEVFDPGRPDTIASKVHQ